MEVIVLEKLDCTKTVPLVHVSQLFHLDQGVLYFSDISILLNPAGIRQYINSKFWTLLFWKLISLVNISDENLPKFRTFGQRFRIK